MKQAGVEPDELTWHPEYGLLITASAVHELADIAPDKERAGKVMKLAADIGRGHIKPVR